jgi:hypothetical protein
MKICPDCDAEYTDWVTTCTDCGATLVGESAHAHRNGEGAEAETDVVGGDGLDGDAEFDDDSEFDDDVEPERIVYELASWSIPAQSTTAQLLAEREIAHEWKGTDLTIDPAEEDVVDALLAEVEQEHGVQPTGTSAGEVVYDLADWTTLQRTTLDGRLFESEVPFRWEGDSLVIAESDEGFTEALLDEVEYGDEEDDGGRDPDDQTVDSLFLAASRLGSDPGDSHGLKTLASVIDQVSMSRPPFGFNRVAWRQIAASTDKLAGLLADGDVPSDDSAAVANELRLLLQPFV